MQRRYRERRANERRDPFDIRVGLDRTIEGLWLAAVVLVPLAFGPPQWFAFFDVRIFGNRPI